MASDRFRARRKPLTRIFLVLVALFAAWHVFAQFLWLSPDSTLKRGVPGDLLTSYQSPFFEQNWAVFAPNPALPDFEFRVRAQVDDGSGKTFTTDWVNPTEAEMTLTRHHLVPARSAGESAKLAELFNNAFAGLSSDQRADFGADWTKPTWPADLSARLSSRTGGATSSTLQAFELKSSVATAYATQVARTAWGKGVQLVQFEARSRAAVPFASRGSRSAQGADTQIVSGWRGLAEFEGQSDENFQRYLKPLLGRTESSHE